MEKKFFSKDFRLLSFVIALFFSVCAFAEEAKNVKITVSFSKILLSEAIPQVEEASGYTFFYDAHKTNLSSRVSLQARNMELGTAVSKMLAGTNIKFQIKDRQIVLYVDKNLVSQQDNTVRGKVIDENGESMIGVNVTVDGTNRGTVTDMDGNFSVQAAKGENLTFSYIGYKELSIKITGSSVQVTMEPVAETLDEVVVVGYGTQKKVNLTGSVSTVNVAELAESRPITNMSSALAGAAAGLSVTSASNRPGADDATLIIRGIGTMNNSSPLVIIDGVEGNLSDVNVNNVENISILKDAASSAIYGSRAANGVILVTTKAGKSGKMKLAYNGYVTFESPRGGILEPVSNYADFMTYMNEGYANSNMGLPYATSTIDEWRKDNGANPLKYPNTNWLKDSFRTGVGSNHTVSMQGGSDAVLFYGSFGYYNNPGIMENAGYQRYHALSNITANITKWLKMGLNMSGYYGNSDPASGSFGWAFATTPAMILRHDGKYGGMQDPQSDVTSSGNNMLASLNGIRGDNITRQAKGKFFITVSPMKDLNITGSLVYEYTGNNTKTIPVFHDFWNFATNTILVEGKGQSYISQSTYRNQRNYMDLVAHYSHRFLEDKLGVGVMVGTSQEQYTTENEAYGRRDLIDLSMNVLNAANGEVSASGSKSVWTMRSYFGRVNLDWESKYLLEFNLRTDGSSRFLKDHRWGYFPSFSAGWRISEEESMKSGFFDNLKLRLSYGSLGNNAIGDYTVRSTYSNRTYVINNQVQTGWAITSLANPNLSWEKTKVADAGFDFGILGNRLTGTFDYFNKKTSGILLWLPVPLVNGDAANVATNAAEVTNKGVELTLGWNDKVGDFTYGISANYTYVTNKINKYKGDEATIDGYNYIKESESLGDLYMYKMNRIIQTDEDLQTSKNMINNNPKAFTGLGLEEGAYPGKGDVLFEDVNGDGLIDSNDRTIVGNKNPTDFLGINLFVGWKGIDLSVSMDGVFGHKDYNCSQYYFSTVMSKDHQISKYIVENAWRQGVTNAKYPMLSSQDIVATSNTNTVWLQNRSFFKIRNIQLGYTFPKNLTRSIFVERLRIYGSLENFFTFTEWKGIDPETANMVYPTMRQAVIGVNVEF